MRVGAKGMGIGLVAWLTLTTACTRSATTAPRASSPDVWASVDGRDIKSEDVERAYRSAVDPGATPTDEEALSVKLNLLDELITQDVLLARARALGLAPTDVELENAFAERKRSVSDEEFQKQLADRKISAEDVKTTIRRELSIQKLIEHDVTAKIAVTDQHVTDYYNAHRAQFNLAEPQYRLAQIVVTPSPDAQVANRMNSDATTLDEARRKLEMLTERLRTGTEFSQLAADFSEDPQTAPQGGDLGFVPESALARVPPQLRDAVVKMQPGSVTNVQIGPNFNILMLIAREPAGQREITNPQVRDGVRDMLKTNRAELLRAAYIAAARDSATITNYLAHRVVDAQGAAASVAAAPAK